MLKRYFHLMLLTVVSLSLFSCAMIPKPHEIPWFDQVYVHDNPKPGDYAVYTNKDKDFDSTWKIEQVNANDIEISWRNDVHVTGVNLDYQTHMIVNPEGKVQRAWIRYDDGREINRPVAVSGGEGSKQNLNRIAVSDGFTLSTPAGEFAIDEGYSYSHNSSLGRGKTNMTNLDYLSSQTPFRLIKTFSMQGFTSGPLLTILQSVALAGSASLNPNSARLFEKTLNETTDFDDEIVLIRYGRGQ